jgi:hypothetical protein
MPCDGSMIRLMFAGRRSPSRAMTLSDLPSSSQAPHLLDGLLLALVRNDVGAVAALSDLECGAKRGAGNSVAS